MASDIEAAVAPSLLGGPLAAGVRLISSDQRVRFDLYVRLVLPLDGYVFWVKAESVSDSALVNAGRVNAFALNSPSTDAVPARHFEAQGSLHYATETRQDEAATYSMNRVVFTALEAVQDLNAVGGELLYIAEVDLPQPGDGEPPATTTPIRFAFSTRGSYYKQANLWHYRGDAVYSTMDTQVVDDPRTLANLQIVSNSLPAWLAFNQYAPAWPVPVERPPIVLYPSYLLPNNLVPPYGVIHIQPADTAAEQSQPYLDPVTSQFQLASDNVVLTLYGANNDAAQSMLYALMQYSFDTEKFGITNMPVVRDEKEIQSELNAIAQKKRVPFTVSYNQGTMRDVARQLIISCVPTIYIDNVVIP